MAALIKSLAVAGAPLMLGPNASEHVPEAVPLVSLSVLEASSDQTIAVGTEPTEGATEQEDSNVAYRRFMVEHETLLGALEEKTRATAYEVGYAEGEKAGRITGLELGEKEGAARYADAVTALEKLLKSGNESLVQGIADAEPLIGAIVFQAVCKIVGDTLKTPEGVKAVVEQALAGARRQEVVSLKVSSTDLNLLLEHEAGLQPGFARLRDIGLEADESVALGGCVVQLKGGHIDARIETQFRAFAQSLKDAVQERG